MKNAPATVKVGYQKVALKFESSVLQSDLGQYSARNQTITVTTEQAKAEIANTTLHEVLHAVWWNQGLHELVPKNLEEGIVNSLANGLAQVIRDNPRLITWLQEQLKG